MLRAPMGAEGGDQVGHHRFKATFEIILEKPGNKDKSEPDPMPEDLVTSLIGEINTVNPSHGGKPYKVENAERK